MAHPSSAQSSPSRAILVGVGLALLTACIAWSQCQDRHSSSARPTASSTSPQAQADRLALAAPEKAGIAPAALSKLAAAAASPDPQDQPLWVDATCTACMDKACNVPKLKAHELCPLTDKVCRSIVDCALKAGCVHSVLGTSRCYCGTVTDMQECVDPKVGKDANGPCRHLYDGALQAKSPKDVLYKAYLSPENPVGRANLALMCMAQACPQACGVKGPI